MMKSNPMIMHINYMEQGQTIDEICRKATEIGYDGIEFRRVRDGVDETPKAYLDQIAEGVKRYGVKYVLFGRPGVNSACEDEAQIAREMDDYKRFVDLAAERFPVEIYNYMAGVISKPGLDYFEVNEHGSAYATEKQFERTVEVCAELGDFMKPYGAKIAFETHMHFVHDTIPATKKLVEAINRENVGINLDYGNMVYFGLSDLSPEKAIDMCGDKLFYLHLKNSVGFMGRRFETALAEGDINHRNYLRHLLQIGYAGCIGIEAPRGGDREYFAQCDYRYAKDLLKTLEAELKIG